MSITYDLRRWAEGDALRAGMSLRTARDHVLAIADRIDAEHERAMAAAAFIAGVPITDENMADHGWIRLPNDADGQYIRIGDVVVEDGCGVPYKVMSLKLFDDCWDVGECGMNPNLCHHYHASTVEDVLREFALAVCKDDALTIRKDVLDEYAAKLRLAEDANA